MEQYLDKMSGKTVLVMGDLMLDRFVYGDVDRISPESPVPVLSVRREENMLGGAGNVLSNLAALGVSCDLLAVVGVDDAAANVRDLVSARGADPEGLIADPDRPTTIKTRFLAAHQQLLRSDFEQAGPVTAAVADRLLTAFAERLPGAQAVILSDYGKGVLTPSLLSAIIAQARTRGVPVLVDPKGTDYSRYRGVQLVTPNRKELALASGGMPLETDAEIVAAARHVIAGAGVEAVLVTRSQDGMSVVRGD
ncbi:MAG: hypothetical protein KDJ15_07645, partial [Alphaproteobacteria bacterium]|nr:hypothetical protein [Alphaproteobacteria bacterium]